MATFALIAWPIIALLIFATLSFTRALVLTVTLGYLFLPAEVYKLNPRGLPPYDKQSAIALGLVLALVLVSRFRAERIETESRDRRPQVLFYGLLGLLVISAGLTWITNTTPDFSGDAWRPGLVLWDAVTALYADIVFFVPFFFARRYLHTPAAHRLLLRILVACAAVYTLLALFEVRMSPQLSVWIYGFFAHDFGQHVRNGHFRPIVFLDHGLSVGFFLFTAFIAAIALAKTAGQRRPGLYWLAGFWFLGVLLLSSNLGALIMAIVFGTFLVVGSRALQVRVAVIVAVVFLTYPALRQTDVLPLNSFTSAIENISPARAQSFRVRLENEEQMLHRGLEKPLAGWGGWARSRVFAGGYDITIADSGWVINFGLRGWVGYIAYFGLLTVVPILMLGRARKRKDISFATAGLVVILAGNLLYIIPNSTLTPVGTLIAGALAGFVQYDVKRKRADAEDSLSPRPRPNRQYSRFGSGAPPAPG